MTVSKTTKYQATVTPTLLNPGDVITVRFIISESGNDLISNRFHIDGRIVGVRNITLVSLSDQQSSNSDKLFSILSIVSAVLSMVLVLSKDFLEKKVIKRFRK